VLLRYERYGIPIKELRVPPSVNYCKYFIHGNCDFKGVLSAKQRYKSKHSTDFNFLEFLTKENVEFTETHRMATLKMESEYLGTAKYDRPEPHMNDDQLLDLKIAFEWACKHFRSCNESCVVSLEKAVSEATLSTSAGLPWSLKYRNKGDALDAIGKQVLDALGKK